MIFGPAFFTLMDERYGVVRVGIRKSLVGEAGKVDADAFEAACEAGEPVGTCGCGGTLSGATERGGGMLWLLARCRSCGQERVAPGGRTRRAAGDAGSPERQRMVLDAASERDAAILGERHAA